MQLPKPYVCAPTPEGKSYLWLPLPLEQFSKLPETVVIEDVLLTKRPEFHVTIGNITAIAQSSGLSEEALLSLFSSYVEEFPIEFDSFIDDFRFMSENMRRSLVVRCTLKNILGLFAVWEKESAHVIPQQPTHVTIYSLAPYRGIGINTKEEMEALVRVNPPEVRDALGLS